MERHQIIEHLHSKCPYAMISCKYTGIGCDAELKRKDMAAHEQDDKFHLHMALETVNLQQSALKVLQHNDKVKQAQLDAQLARLNSLQADSKIFVLHEYRKKKNDCQQFLFPSFYSHHNGYRMALNVDAYSMHVRVSAPILQGKYDAELKWPFVGKVTFTLLNQLEDKNHCTGIVSFDAARNARAGGSTWSIALPFKSTLAHDPAKNTQYLKDDTLYFRVAVEVARPWLAK
jgi:hypothetical protein